MRRLSIAIALLVLVALLGGTAGAAGVGARRSDAFATAAQQLRQRWAQEERDGVNASRFAPLEQRLSAGTPASSSWAPAWLTDDGMALIRSLQQQTDSVWSDAVASSRSQAQAALLAWQRYEQAHSALVPAKTAALAQSWPQDLAQASTPAALDALAQQFSASLQEVTQVVTAAQAPPPAPATPAAPSQPGSRQTLLASAAGLVTTAQDDNLDDAGATALLATVRAEAATDPWPTAADQQLQAAVATLQQEVTINGGIAAMFRPDMLAMDQALAEGTSDSGSFSSRYAAMQPAYTAARTVAQLQAVQQQMLQLGNDIDAELVAQRCGHAVGAGKVITISLSLQEMVFYQDGCEVQATPVSTGRPLLRTPTGHFSLFYKTAPFQFISPWPKSSPFWYPPSWVSWVMEFADGGYYIHDAPWEAPDAFGPGSENNDNSASHGCVHTPTPVMQWAYSWAPLGTPVIISA